MTKHVPNRSEHDHTSHRPSRVWKPHKDWRVWVGFLLMLAAIVAYVLTLDDSIIPQ